MRQRPGARPGLIRAQNHVRNHLRIEARHVRSEGRSAHRTVHTGIAIGAAPNEDLVDEDRLIRAMERSRTSVREAFRVLAGEDGAGLLASRRSRPV